MANVKFIKGNTATINGTTIADGQLLWNTVTGEIWEDVGTSRIECGKIVDTSLNPISTNAVSNQAITGSIVNSLATVISTTENYVPCGTKPVKELYDERNGTVLWTNPSPTSSFAGGERTLSKAIEGFSYYRIIWASSNTTTSVVFSTNKIPSNRTTALSYAVNDAISRTITTIALDKITFADAYTTVFSPYSYTIGNTRAIPLQIIGYK